MKLLNQYTSRTAPGYLNVRGTATNTATVSLWSPESTALYASTTRKGEYFRGELPFNNSTNALKGSNPGDIEGSEFRLPAARSAAR